MKTLVGIGPSEKNGITMSDEKVLFQANGTSGGCVGGERGRGWKCERQIRTNIVPGCHTLPPPRTGNALKFTAFGFKRVFI